MKRVQVLILAAALVAISAPAEDLFPADQRARTAVDEATSQKLSQAWKRSLIPLLASQSLDAASSYGYRELNPLLADRDGRFGVRATTLKFGVIGALIGMEYLVARKSPRMANLLSKMNWSGAAVTTGFAVHNYAVR